MKYQIPFLVVAISFINSTIVLANDPILSNPDVTTVKYQDGITNSPIIEVSGNTGINNLILKNVTINDIDESKLTSMSKPAIISLGGNNGSFAGEAVEHQRYGDLSISLDKNTLITTNLTNTDEVIGVYSRTDSPDGKNVITSAATINIISSGHVIGVSSQNFSDSSGNGSGGIAELNLTGDSNITVSGSGVTADDGAIAAQAHGDNAVIKSDTGGNITVIGQNGSGTLTGLDSWGYNGTSSVTNNGTIDIDASLSSSAFVNALTATSKEDNTITHNGVITTNGGASNTGINAYSENGTIFVQTAKGSLIDVKSSASSVSNGIKLSGNNELNIVGDINVEGGKSSGVSGSSGSSTINHLGDIKVTGNSSAIGISIQSIGVGDKAYIQSSGNIDVTSNSFTAGVYNNIDTTVTFIYDNSQGHIAAASPIDMSTTSVNSAIGVFNKSMSDDSAIVIRNADYISAKTVGNGSSAFAIQNASLQGDSYIGVTNVKQVIASSEGATTAISSMVDGGVGNSQIDLQNINNISSSGNHDVFAIASQNTGAGDSIIIIDSSINNIISSSVTNTGKNAGIYSSSRAGNSSIISAAKNISTMGDGNHGIFSESVSGNSLITTSSHIDAMGDKASAIYATTASGNNKINLAAGADIQGGIGDQTFASGIAMQSDTGEQQLDISTGAKISSLNDSAIYSSNTSGKTTVNNNGRIIGRANLSGNNVVFNNQTAGILDLKNFSNGSKSDIIYTIGTSGGVINNAGTIKFADENFDGTATNAIFNVATLTNSGIIDLTGKNPTGANNLVGDTFTINGNYVSDGGSIYLNTLLDDASSNAGQGTSDLIIVNGNVTTSSGATNLYITPTASTANLGQLTTGNGIKVVEVQGTSSSDAFQLGRPVVAGAYEYTLGQGQSDDSWYLSSYYKGNAGGNGIIQYNPAIGAYLANQTAAVQMFQQTLFDRLISSSDGKNNDASKSLFWMRTKMTHGSYDSVHGQLNNRNRSYSLQMGGDLNVWALDNGGYFHLGMMAGYGDAKNTNKSDSTGTKTDGKVKGYTTGVYGTYFANQDTNLGLYVDLWSQMGWYRNEISGEAQQGTKKYNSTVWSNSVELGYGIPLTESGDYQWLATPQAQFTYNHYDADNQHDKNNLSITNNNASGLDTRLGVRFHARGIQKDLIEPFLEVNWLDTTAKNELDFNGKSYKDGFAKDRLEAKIGLQGNINKQWSVSAQVGGQWGNNSFSNYQGQLNVNYKF